MEESTEVTTIAERNHIDDIASFIQDKVNAIDENKSQKQETDPLDVKRRIYAILCGGKYGQAISLLIEYMDNQQDIQWHVISSPKIANKELLIRDARHCKTPDACTIPYIIMAINNLRAAKALLPEEQFRKIKSYLALLIRNFYLKNIQSNRTVDTVLEDLNLYNTVLINNLALILNIKFDEARERLAIAKDFVNLEEESRHIVTLTSLYNDQGQKITVFQGDFASTDLTDEIKKEYLSREENKWYQILPAWQKALVDLHIPYILKGRVLPTQLRMIPLIGLRNAYEAINGILANENNDELIVTTHAFHSGTIVALGQNEEENKRIGRLHGKQLIKATGASKVLTLTLNSEINPTGNDNIIVKGTGFIAKSEGLIHSNLPLNAARRASPNNYSGIYDLLKASAELLIPELKKYCIENEVATSHFDDLLHYLISQKSVYKEKDFIERNLLFLVDFKNGLNLESEKEKAQVIDMCEILNICLEMSFISHNNMNVSDPDNRNLALGCFTNILVTRLEAYLSVAVNSSCESGKDRDGLLMFRTALISFSRVLFNSYSLTSTNTQLNDLIQGNIILLARAGHVQFLAGCQGGTYGAFGIKKDSKSAIPEIEFPSEARQLLIKATASFNKQINILEEKTGTLYYPIGNTEFESQRAAISHVLLLQEQIINAQFISPHTMTASKRYTATIFKSSSISIKRAHYLANTISRLAELPDDSSLEELSSIIGSAISQQKQLTDNSVIHGEGNTYALLLSIHNSLNLIQIHIKNQKGNTIEQKSIK